MAMLPNQCVNREAIINTTTNITKDGCCESAAGPSELNKHLIKENVQGFFNQELESLQRERMK